MAKQGPCTHRRTVPLYDVLLRNTALGVFLMLNQGSREPSFLSSLMELLGSLYSRHLVYKNEDTIKGIYHGCACRLCLVHSNYDRISFLLFSTHSVIIAKDHSATIKTTISCVSVSSSRQCSRYREQWMAQTLRVWVLLWQRDVQPKVQVWLDTSMVPGNAGTREQARAIWAGGETPWHRGLWLSTAVRLAYCGIRRSQVGSRGETHRKSQWEQEQRGELEQAGQPRQPGQTAGVSLFWVRWEENTRLWPGVRTAPG